MEPIIYQTNASIIVIMNGSTHTIPEGEEFRYNSVLKLIKNQPIDVQKLDEILNPHQHFGLPGFEMIEGSLYLNKKKLDNEISLELIKNEKQLMGLYNFLNNCQKRNWEDYIPLLIQSIQNDGYLITKDGFYVVHSGNIIQNDENDIFYTYNECFDDNLVSDFKNKKSLDELMIKYFGFKSRKLEKIIKKNVFRNGIVFENYFLMGFILKDILKKENLVYFLENYDSFIENLTLELNDNLQTEIINFLKKYRTNNKKLLELFKDHGSFSSLVQSIKMYMEIKEKVDIELENITFSNFSQLYRILLEEAKKVNTEKIEIPIVENFPALNANKKALRYKNYKLVYPTSNYDLMTWSSKMSNCIRGYSDIASRTTDLIMAVLDENDEMVFNFHFEKCNINGWRIREFKAPQNVRKEDSKIAKEILNHCIKEITEWKVYRLLYTKNDDIRIVVLKDKPTELDGFNLNRIFKGYELTTEGFITATKLKECYIKGKEIRDRVVEY